MEEFKNIDWTPNIEHIIDEKFVDEKRLRAESAMYRILSGTFEDPFQDIRPPVFKTDQAKLKVQGKPGLSKKSNHKSNTEKMPKKKRGKKKKIAE